MPELLNVSSARVRMALSAAVIIAGGLLAGCPPAQKPSETAGLGGLSGSTAPVVGNEPVAGGIYSSLGSYTPLSGAALSRALLDRQTIRATVTASVAPSTSAAAPPTTEAASDAEPPPLAVKYYLQGREKFLDGANTEAMEFLDKALQLDPNAFTVLRLMGRVCFASSQLARGALYLQRAQQEHPTDVEVNYLLGRYWLERKDFDRAVYYLLQADDSPERAISSAETPLVSFYLARAFQAAGFHKAAAAEYDQFLETAAVPVPGYRYDRELNYLIEEEWATHLAAAENEVMVGDYARALPNYEAAAHEQPNDAFIASRLVNALMHTGKNAEARETALTLVETTKGAEESLQLVAWVYRADHRENQLVPDLRTHLRFADANDPAPTLTLAAALDYVGRKKEAFATLDDYLRQHPTDTGVLERLLKRVDSAGTFGEGMSAAARAITASPAQSEDVIKLFAPLTETPAAEAYVRQTNPSPTSAAEAYLTAVTLQARNADPHAIDAAFRSAIDQQPNLEVAREGYVTWLLSQEKFKEASALVEEAIHKNQGGAKAWRLLIESEAAQQRYSIALRLATEAKQKYPDSPEIRYQLANIYRLRVQTADADAELNHLIDEFPKFEPGYVALINSLVARSQDAAQGDSQDLNAAVTALGRLMREIPNSKFGQVTSATVYARAGRFEEAEAMLRRFLQDNPDDPDALDTLAQITRIVGRPSDAISMLQESLSRRPQVQVARTLATVYHEQDKQADAITLATKLAKENPDSEEFTLLEASVLQTAKKSDEAIVLLTDATSRFPRSEEAPLLLARLQETAGDEDSAIKTMQAFLQRNGETPERLYVMSHFYSAAGKDDAMVSVLERVLVLMPDHTGANNDLGYFWADEGIRLDQAEPMIRKATDNEPNNPAFLDSLGWLCYKQGKFNEAVTWLQKSVALPEGREPEVLQHLGDSLYRADRKPEAVEWWTQAQALLGIESGPLPKDEQRVKDYLDKVISAERSGGTPTLSPTATEPKPQSAGPTSMPGATSQ